jgi:CRISPR/Cas system-associated exonuclease Cas4 (RecB family)
MCYTLGVKVIRSSDIGNYLYCRRAWMYRQQGFESDNQAELASGTELHRAHGRKVMAAGLYRSLALIILLVALTLFVAFCTSQLFP